jgi:hypothetical protein
MVIFSFQPFKLLIHRIDHPVLLVLEPQEGSREPLARMGGV